MIQQNKNITCYTQGQVQELFNQTMSLIQSFLIHNDLVQTRFKIAPQICWTRKLKFWQLQGPITVVSKSVWSHSFSNSKHSWKSVKCCYFHFPYRTETLGG